MNANNDPRFSAMATAPMFSKVKKDKYKTKVDDRFTSMLHDDRFAGEGNVDIYGRKQKKKVMSKAVKEMQSLYTNTNTNDNDNTNTTHKTKLQKGKSGGDNGADSRLEYLNKLVRGEISLNSSDEGEGEGDNDDDDSHRSNSSVCTGDDDSDAESDDDHGEYVSALAIPNVSQSRTGSERTLSHNSDETSNRLAIQNCDWESISAKDMM